MALGIAPFEGVQASSDRTSMMSGGTGAFNKMPKIFGRYAVHEPSFRKKLKLPD